jgi:hypothetical protein
VLAPGEPHPQGDDQRRGELDEQRDAHRHPLDRDEVEPLDHRDPGDAEDGEQAELPAVDRQRARAPGRGQRRERRGGEHAADLDQPERRQAVLEDQLAHRAVDGEQPGGRERRGPAHHHGGPPARRPRWAPPRGRARRRQVMG